MSKYSISNKDIIIFFVVTFSFTIVMGIAMALAHTEYQVDSFSVLQMCYPAIGVMIALLLNKERRKELPIKFFRTYLFFPFTSIFYFLVQIFIFNQDPRMNLELWLIIGSITLIIVYFMEDKEKINCFGLRFRKNGKASILYIVFFVILYLCATFLSALIFGSIKETIAPFLNLKTLISLFFLPLLFPLTFIPYLARNMAGDISFNLLFKNSWAKERASFF